MIAYHHDFVECNFKFIYLHHQLFPILKQTGGYFKYRSLQPGKSPGG